MNQTQKGILIKIAAVGAFAIMDACLKYLSEHYGSFQVAFFRGIAALPFIIALVSWKGSWSDMKSTQWKLHILRTVMAISMLAAIVFAFRELPLADAYSIFYAAPLFVTLLSVIWLKETVGRHRWTALAVGMCAVLFMFQPSGVGLSAAVLACLYGTFIYAVLIIMLKIMHRTENTLSLTFNFTLYLTIGAAFLAVIDWQPLQMEDIIWLGLLGLSGAAAQVLLTEAYRIAPASSLAPFEYSSILWAIVIGWLIWSDVPGIIMLISSVILILTGIYILKRENIHQLDSEAVVLAPSNDADPVLEVNDK